MSGLSGGTACDDDLMLFVLVLGEIRKQLGLSFEGQRLRERMILGEVEIKGLDGEVGDCPLGHTRDVVTETSRSTGIGGTTGSRGRSPRKPSQSSHTEHTPDTCAAACSSARRRPPDGSGMH